MPCMAELIDRLASGLSNIVTRSHGEVNIVENFVDFINRDVTPHFARTSADERISVEARFVHQTPYAFFVHPSKICGKGKVELGDILFIIKRRVGGRVTDYRGSFSQAKLLDGRKWKIEPHQFEFLHRINNIRFRFGNCHSSHFGRDEPIEWEISTTARWFSSYLLLSEFCCACIPPDSLADFYDGECRSFNVTYCDSGRTNQCPGPNFRDFLSRFFIRGGAGFPVSDDLRDIVEMLYRLVGLHPDPPEEFLGFVEEDKSGFAIIRFEIEQDKE